MLELIGGINLPKVSISVVAVAVLLYIFKKELNNLYSFSRTKIINFVKNIFSDSSPKNIDIRKITHELNQFFKDEVEFYTIFNGVEPQIEVTGNYYNNSIKKKDIDAEKTLIKNEQKHNEPHVLLNSFTDLDSKNVIFQAEITDFATIRLLRKKGIKPKIISAGAILVDPESQELIVHKRAKKSDTYPDHYHILGGAFLPKSKRYSTTYDHKLSHTIRREIHEETENNLTITKLTPPKFMTFSCELTTGFIQYEYLGLTVKIKEGTKGNWEGDISPINFSDLEDKLKTLMWVPSGKAHVLAWLALGAPGSGYFKYKEARKIYESIIADTNKSH